MWSNVGESGLSLVTASVRFTKSVSDKLGLADASVFLTRVARAESNLGLDARTYRANYHGGIWQVDDVAFRASQDTQSHPSLIAKHQKIKEHFQRWDGNPLSWKDLAWIECRRPAVSCLAARIFLSNIPQAIPTSLEDQAHYWKTHYNTSAGAGSVQHFIAVNS